MPMSASIDVRETNHKAVHTLVWGKANEQEFQGCITSIEMQNMLGKATEEITLAADKALSLFLDCLQEASKCMVKQRCLF